MNNSQRWHYQEDFGGPRKGSGGDATVTYKDGKRSCFKKGNDVQ